MWSRLATIILRGRLPILIALAVITASMATRIDELGIRYKFGGLLPDDDPALVAYNDFLEEFGEEGNVVALGIEDGRLDSLEVFRAWWDLDSVLRAVQVPVDSLKPDGTPWEVHVVDSVFGFRTAVELVRVDDPKSFVMEPVFGSMPADQSTLDSTLDRLRSLPFYEGFLHTESGATIQMIYVNAPLFNSENRGRSVELLVEEHRGAPAERLLEPLRQRGHGRLALVLALADHEDDVGDIARDGERSRGERERRGEGGEVSQRAPGTRSSSLQGGRGGGDHLDPARGARGGWQIGRAHV